MAFSFGSVALAAAGLLAIQPAAALTPEQMCVEITRDVQEYLSTGHPCPCPYNLTRKGKECGRLSAWAKPSGRAPRCYFGDLDGTYPPNPKGGRLRTGPWPARPSCTAAPTS